MPYFKTFYLTSEFGAKINIEPIPVKISVSTKGHFYCNLPNHFLPAIKEAFDDHGPNYRIGQEANTQVRSSTYKHMEKSLKRMIKIYSEPDVTETPVIRYIIESKISFAEDVNGNVYPCTPRDGVEWATSPAGEHKNKEKMYGKNMYNSWEGYSLLVGAKAMLKKTFKFGDQEKVEYSYYRNRDKHKEEEDPAVILNSWTCMNVRGDSVKEIPYSDKAALFFHSLLLGMARLSKLIQESTFDQEDLLSLIEGEGQLLLLPGGTKA